MAGLGSSGERIERLYGRMSLPTLCTVLALASAVTVLALDRIGIISAGPASESQLDPAPVSAEIAQVPADTASIVEWRSGDRDIAELIERRVATRVIELPVASLAPEPRQTVAFLSPQAAPLFLRALSNTDDEPFVDTDGADGWVADAWTVETTPQSLPARPAPGPRLAAPEALPWQRAARPAAVQTADLKARLAEISPAASKRLAEKFVAAGSAFPPADIALVAIKDQKTLELHARASNGVWKHIHNYRVLAASGGAGPKLRQGDKQVPEGIYGISFLNPNSRYHVSLRVNYPNAFDRQMAQREGRTNLGGDIMIHGKNVSAGCLAVGDEAAEELFVLAERIGLQQVKLIIAPTDFRKNGVPDVDPAKPQWVKSLYTEVASAMAPYKAPTTSISLLSLFGN